MLIDNVLAL